MSIGVVKTGGRTSFFRPIELLPNWMAKGLFGWYDFSSQMSYATSFRVVHTIRVPLYGNLVVTSRSQV